MFKMITKLFKKIFRIAYNEVDSVLDKMESLEKSLKNALEEHQERYKQYKLNCAKIFSLEVELTNDVKSEETAISKMNAVLEKQKEVYYKSPSEDTKTTIMFFLGKLQHHESKKDVLKTHLMQQVEQNKQVTLNLKNYEHKISELKQKVDYVQTQIKIAKNKEMMMELNDGTGSVYNISDVFERVQNYIAEVDGKSRVEEIVGNDEHIILQAEESVRNNDLNQRFEEFMNGSNKQVCN